MDPTSRLRIATRIHFALLRHFSEDVDVRTLLQNGPDAREALWVCEASGNTELMSLARQFRLAEQAERADAAARRSSMRGAPPPAVPQDMRWSQDTSGFGLTRPPEEPDPKTGPTASPAWPSPMSWLRRSSARLR